MKKMITSMILAASMLLNAVPMASTAEEIVKKRYTYNELLEMSDEEVAELFSEYDRYSKCGFGDDTMEDSEKFDLFYPYSQNIDGSWDRGNGDMRLSMLEGRYDSVFRIYVKDDFELDFNRTADYFGYPSDWQIEASDVNENPSQNNIPPSYYLDHSYYIYVPHEVLEDFELYARLMTSFWMNPRHDYEDVKLIATLYDSFLPLASRPYDCGDVNLDYVINMADAVTILQYLSNPDKYPLSGAAKAIGDVDGNDGLTANDALRIQKYLLKQVDNLYEPAEER